MRPAGVEVPNRPKEGTFRMPLRTASVVETKSIPYSPRGGHVPGMVEEGQRSVRPPGGSVRPALIPHGLLLARELCPIVSPRWAH